MACLHMCSRASFYTSKVKAGVQPRPALEDLPTMVRSLHHFGKTEVTREAACCNWMAKSESRRSASTGTGGLGEMARSLRPFGKSEVTREAACCNWMIKSESRR